MHVLGTSYGPRRLPGRRLIDISVTPADLYGLVRWLEREATAALNDNHDAAADLLLDRAAAFREAGR